MDQLDGKVAVVTGAADGIGRALSEALAGHGMNVVLADIDPAGVSRAAEELAPSGVLGFPRIGARAAPAEVAAQVVDAVRDDRFWILTHPGYRELLEDRHESMLTGAHPLTVPGFFLR